MRICNPIWQNTLDINLLENLKQYYKLDNNVTDSLNVYNATTTATYTTGKINNCSTFSGTQFITIPSTSIDNYRGGNDISFSGWIRLTTAPGVGNYRSIYHIIAMNDFPKEKVEIGLLVDSNRRLRLHDGNLRLTSTSSILLNNWYHVVTTLENNGIGNVATYKIYINGNLDNSANLIYNPASGGGPLFLIGKYFDNTRYWVGQIDEIGFWNRVLNKDEVSRLYNNGNGLPFSNF